MTPPVDVITTTIRTCGCSVSNSMWRIVEVSSGGAVTIASRFVTCESASVVTRIASSTSRRTSDRLEHRLVHELRVARDQAVDEVAVAGLGRHAAGRRVRMGEQAELLEVRELMADRGRAPLEARRQRLRADRRADVQVRLDDAPQHEFLSIAQHLQKCSFGTARPLSTAVRRRS